MKRVLLLNSSYEPVSFVSERKAMSLVIRDVVDLVIPWNERDTLLPRHGPDNAAYPMPAVLRLRQYRPRASRMPRFRRHVMFARDGYRCQYCDRRLTHRDATVDHVVPRSSGGDTSWKNCVTACKPCNLRKENYSLAETDMRLLRRPSVPTVEHFWDVRYSDTCWHDSWNDFVSKNT